MVGQSRESFWMIPKLSSIVIMNLIAKLPLLYHKPKNTRILHLTDPDSDNLKAAAEYLLEVARTTEGRRYRKQPKMDATGPLTRP
jgi:hypothetical protein